MTVELSGMRTSASRGRRKATVPTRFPNPLPTLTVLALFLLIAAPAEAGLKQSETAALTVGSVADAAAPADLLPQAQAPETTIALGTAPRLPLQREGGVSTALPNLVQPETVLDAVTVDLPVWPWSKPVETHIDDPKQGYNIWTYGLALLLIAGGLVLGRRRTEETTPKRSKRLVVANRQPDAAD